MHMRISLDVDLEMHVVFVRLKEGTYVLSAVLHAPKEGSRQFINLVPSFISTDQGHTTVCLATEIWDGYHGILHLTCALH